MLDAKSNSGFNSQFGIRLNLEEIEALKCIYTDKTNVLY